MSRQDAEKLSVGRPELTEVVLHFIKPEKAVLEGQDEFELETCFLSVSFAIEKWVDRANCEAFHRDKLESCLGFLKAFLSDKLLLGFSINNLLH